MRRVRAGKSPHARSWTRRILVGSAWIVGGLLLLLGVGWGLRGLWLTPILLARLSERLERDHGYTLVVDRVGGDWIHELELGGVSLVSSRPRRGLERLSIAVATVQLDWKRLWRREVAGIERIDASGVVLRVDLSRPGEEGRPLPPLLERLPPLAVLDLDLEVLLEGGRSIHANQVSIRAAPEDQADLVAVEIGALELLGKWPERLRRFEGRATAGYRAGRIDLRTLELSGDLEARLESSLVDLSGLPANELRLELRGEALAGRFELDLNRRHDEWLANFELDDVDLAALSRVAALTPLDGRLTCTGEASIAEDELWCSARGRASDVCVEGRAIDRLEFDASVRPGQLDVTALDVLQGVNSAWARGVQVPIHRGTWLEQLRAARGAIGVDLRDVTALTGVAPGRVPAHRVVLSGVLDERGVELTDGVLSTAKGEFTVRRGRVSWGGPSEPVLESTTFDVELATAFDDLSSLGVLFGTEPWSGSLRGTLHLTGSLRAPVGELDLVGRKMVVAGYPLGDLESAVRVAGALVTVQTLEAHGELGRLSLEGEYDYERETIERASWSLATERLPDLLPRWVVSGAIDVEGQVSGPLRAPTGSFQARVSELEVAGLPRIASASVAGSAGGSRVQIDSLSASVEGVSIHLTGAVEHTQWNLPLTIELDTGSVLRQSIELSLASPTTIRLERDAVRIDAFDLRGTGGTAKGSFRSQGSDLWLRLTSDELEPMALLRPVVRDGFEIGRTSADVDVQRVAGRWSGRANVQAQDVWLTPDLPPLALDLQVEAQAGRLRIASLEIGALGVIEATFEGNLPFDEVDPLHLVGGPLELTAKVELAELRVLPWELWKLDGTCDGSLSLRAEVAGAWPSMCGFVEADAYGLRWEPAARFGVAPELAFDVGSLSSRIVLDRSLQLERLELTNGERIAVAFEGLFLGEDDLNALVDRRGETWRDAKLDLRGHWTLDDLSLVAPLVPGLRRTGGSSSGEVSLRGTWGAPTGHGAFRVEDLEIRFEGGLPPFESLDGIAVFDGARVRFERWKGELAGGPFELGGSIDFGGGEANYDLRLVGSELLLVRRRDLRIRADADLTLSGPKSELVLRGSLRTRDSRWTRDVDWFRRGSGGRAVRRPLGRLFSIERGPFAAMRFDVAIDSLEPLVIDTNVARGGLSADLHLMGTGLEPQLSGALFLTPTRVFLPASTLELRSGTLTIDRREPLDPGLDLQLSSRVRGYDVTVRVSGNYSEPQVEFASVPPLPSEDILLLLLTGRPPGESLTGETGVQAAETVIVYLGKDLVTKFFDSDQVSLLERVEWQTGSDVTQAGGSTAQVSIRLLGETEGEGRALYLRGEKDVYDRINYGMRFVLRLR